jgi:hypothetical protein
VLTSSITLGLPRLPPTATRLVEIVERERASMFASGLFAAGIVSFAVGIAFAIAGP